ncbi:MAG: ABC transporter substrate-binding protein [Oleiphilaceae bacterium]|nr:ABC transporter substrate-binding protein [Oleiphilaceae bacterium]
MRRHYAAITSRLLLVVVMFVSLLSCGNNDPVKIGFIGGLSGPVSDLGGPSRNGMLLAIEAINRQGGIGGHHIQTFIKDDKQDPATARKAIAELIKEEVDVIIGPVTSTMAMAVIDQVNEAQVLMMGVTVTTDELSGKDDYFIRCLASTDIHAAKVAHYLVDNLGLKSYSAIIDLSNASYTQSWIQHFEQTFKQQGGAKGKLFEIHSGDHQGMVETAAEAAAVESDIVVLVTNALDGAILAKILRSHDENIMLALAEWAGTERLIELGGRFVENAIVPQYINNNSTSASYLDFRERYMERFTIAPGFPSMIAYDATNVVLQALQQNADTDALKQTILSTKNYHGLHGDIQIDKFGDGTGHTFITQVQNGRFRVKARE